MLLAVLQNLEQLTNSFVSTRIAATAEGQSLEVAFDYVPGAGDDEESWAKGLTPEIFWQQKEVNLISAS